MRSLKWTTSRNEHHLDGAGVGALMVIAFSVTEASPDKLPQTMFISYSFSLTRQHLYALPAQFVTNFTCLFPSDISLVITVVRVHLKISYNMQTIIKLSHSYLVTSEHFWNADICVYWQILYNMCLANPPCFAVYTYACVRSFSLNI